MDDDYWERVLILHAKGNSWIDVCVKSKDVLFATCKHFRESYDYK